MKKQKSVGSHTIFDDVYRTMIQKMPELALAVINEAFGTEYTENEPYEQLRNEHYEAGGKIVTDSIFRIRGKSYHIECQSTEDGTMALRMLEYDFSIALEEAVKGGKPYVMRFPAACVLYLRHTIRTPDRLEVRVSVPQGKSFIYTVPVVKVQEYTKEEIFQKRLLLFLPYYIMRYEKEFDIIEADKAVFYTNIVKLTTGIADHMLKAHRKARKGVDRAMGGQVLELESERLLRIGRREGKIEGKREGIEEGRKTEAEVRITSMLQKGKSTEEIVDFCDYPREIVERVSAAL